MDHIFQCPGFTVVVYNLAVHVSVSLYLQAYSSFFLGPWTKYNKSFGGLV